MKHEAFSDTQTPRFRFYKLFSFMHRDGSETLDRKWIDDCFEVGDSHVTSWGNYGAEKVEWIIQWVGALTPARRTIFKVTRMIQTEEKKTRRGLTCSPEDVSFSPRLIWLISQFVTEKVHGTRLSILFFLVYISCYLFIIYCFLLMLISTCCPCCCCNNLNK